MCGIVGYVGHQQAGPILLEGLKRLEYRGYDSAGVALLDGAEDLLVLKKTGSPDRVGALMRQHENAAHTGISHTRWATHGEVTDRNAHPHCSSDGKFAIVHNGVIENYQAIRRFLEGQGYSFVSETDSEALANLIAYHFAKEPEQPGKNRFTESVRKSLLHVDGTYGLAVVCIDRPGEIVGARKGSPLCVGIGQGENMIASDVAAFLNYTRRVVYLDDGQVVTLSPQDYSITTVYDESVAPVERQVEWNIEEADLGAFAHYMEKEIFEQPKALENAMRGRFSDDCSTAKFGGLNVEPRELRQIDRVVFLGQGTAYLACMVAEYFVERYARIPVEVEYSSEFRYRNAPLDKNTLVFVISQSGETLDSLEAMREAMRKGYRTLAITNTVGSTIARENDGGIYQHCGPEISVAATKSFTSQLVLCAMVALFLGRMRDLSYAEGRAISQALRHLPGHVTQVLNLAEHIQKLAAKYAHFEDMIFLGRQDMYPIALEGALKLKEITYIHAEGYQAAEMKHGPIALINERCPSIFLVPRGESLPKMLSNVQEVRARKGPVILITNAPESEVANDAAEDIIRLPDGGHEVLDPVLFTVPVQLFAYYVALARGLPVDKPRNLAKSVTVE
ncbi:MAG: glucosamine--fructose-6-phosphate aminotransferase (isomerizing) [Puniceicoccaceae bacterium 5H]|nr:MAG: glucosamine--fructose-6-phosphate aminotransferase (isomerizing) [Puniceicoccaceae bacterium 5H]